MNKILLALTLTLISFSSFSATSRYDMVAKEYEQIALKANVVEGAKMQGVCLVQLKELTFKKKNELLRIKRPGKDF